MVQVWLSWGQGHYSWDWRCEVEPTWVVKAAAEEVGVEGSAKEEEIVPSSTSVLRGRMDQTAQLVRLELDHCTA